MTGAIAVTVSTWTWTTCLNRSSHRKSRDAQRHRRLRAILQPPVQLEFNPDHSLRHRMVSDPRAGITALGKVRSGAVAWSRVVTTSLQAGVGGPGSRALVPLGEQGAYDGAVTQIFHARLAVADPPTAVRAPVSRSLPCPTPLSLHWPNSQHFPSR